MRETIIEAKLRDRIKKLGGRALKFVSPGTNGVPDRIILLPGGRVAFVETKAPGKKLRPLQEYRAEQLRALGFKVYQVDRPEQVEQILEDLFNGI